MPLMVFGQFTGDGSIGMYGETFVPGQSILETEMNQYCHTIKDSHCCLQTLLYEDTGTLTRHIGQQLWLTFCKS